MYSVPSSYSSPPWTQSSNMISRGTRAKNHKRKSNSIWMLEATQAGSVWTQGKERMLQPPPLLRGPAGSGSSEWGLSEMMFYNLTPTKNILMKPCCKGNQPSSLSAFNVRTVLCRRTELMVWRIIRNIAGLDGGTEVQLRDGRICSGKLPLLSTGHDFRITTISLHSQVKT